METNNYQTESQNFLNYIQSEFKYIPNKFNNYIKENPCVVTMFTFMTELHKHKILNEHDLLVDFFAFQNISSHFKDIGLKRYEMILKGKFKPTLDEVALETTISLLKKRGNFSLIVTVLKQVQRDTSFYSKEMKEAALYFYINVGAGLYEYAHQNMGFPSLSTTKRFLNQFDPIEENKLRAKELNEWLERHELPKRIWLSEDATKCLIDISFDQKTHTLIGFQPGINENGMPIENQFTTESLPQIKSLFENSKKAEYLYVIMAQPLQRNSPSFMLLTFGQPDFNFQHCINRTKLIKSELKKFGIDVIGWSADGDPRLLKAMNLLSRMGDPSNKVPDVFSSFINADLDSEIACIQDESHICNKLKNRLLTQSEPVVMGYNGQNACMAHLLLLDQQNLKAKTKLSSGDIHKSDPMSSNQALKLSSDLVIDTLKQIDNFGTIGTRLFLLLIKEQHLAMFSQELTPSERFVKLFFVVFVFRAIYNERNNFKKYLKDYKYSSFITLNAYKCLELNAANLLNVARKLRNKNEDKYFLPWLFQSQTCESYFRTLRSFTPNRSTIINFNGLQGISKMHKIQTLIDLTLSLYQQGFKFPKQYPDQNIVITTEVFKIPDDRSLANSINSARSEAMHVLSDFFSSKTQWSVKESFSLSLDLYARSYEINEIEDAQEADEETRSYEIEEINLNENIDIEIYNAMDDPVMSSDIDLLLECDGLFQNAKQGDSIKNSNYLSVEDESGESFYISIKTYVWYLNNHIRMSNDRLRRFRTNSSKVIEYFRREETTVEKMDDIMKLDFIIFQGRVAQVLDFKYMPSQKTKQTAKSMRFESNSLDITDARNKKKVGILVQYYKLNYIEKQYVLQRSSNKNHQIFIDSEHYETHIPRPIYINGTKTYTEKEGELINNYLNTQK